MHSGMNATTTTTTTTNNNSNKMTCKSVRLFKHWEKVENTPLDLE